MLFMWPLALLLFWRFPAQGLCDISIFSSLRVNDVTRGFYVGFVFVACCWTSQNVLDIRNCFFGRPKHFERPQNCWTFKFVCVRPKSFGRPKHVSTSKKFVGQFFGRPAKFSDVQKLVWDVQNKSVDFQNLFRRPKKTFQRHSRLTRNSEAPLTSS